jgi:hypothetical protein
LAASRRRSRPRPRRRLKSAFDPIR